MSTQKHVKVAITGAAGQIGYALVYRIASGQMFGPDVEVSLHLIELAASLPALEGVVMELHDCAFPLLRNVVCTDDLAKGMRDVNWAVLVGAVPRKAGMERSDLLKINGSVFTAQGKAINDNAADDVRIFVVGNPCNTNCLIAMSNAKDIPHDRFYAMTMLDELRAKAQLAMRAQCAVKDVSQMVIWGNHSATQYPDFYNAKINQQSALAVIQDENWLQNDFVNIVQQRGAAVIKARGASSAASAANAIVHGIYQLTHDTVKDDCYSMCCYSNGEYGVDKGLIFSYPCRTLSGKLQIVSGMDHNDYGKKRLSITLDELRQEREAVKALGLI
ncbi:MAG: mdh [Gammaproteobacteria bacterium]|nr:mdh [Gammaproteobacteria bacterium]